MSAFAPDIEFTEHGIVALPSLRGVDEVKRAFLALFEVGDGIDNRTDDILGLEANVWLLRATLSGTGRASGGLFERPLLSLCVFGPDGRVVRYEAFDVERADDALARFDAIGASVTRPEPRFANAASRAIDRLASRFYAHDWAGLEAGVDPAARVHDRRRMMHLGIG